MPDLGFIVIAALVVLTPVIVIGLMRLRNGSLASLDQDGARVKARVVDVRDDRSEMQTVVTYRYADRSGTEHERTGCLQRDQPMPRVGGLIDVVYLPSRPTFSRLRLEEGCEFQ